ncbi:MAG: 3-oxoacyl-[acyl-carrier-protein] reductase FabG [Chlamydiae bacterium]|nr:3-oxoacyl-[acyl-carrier-protein] reductase FabG [Chlamydiota bacterium]
MNKLVLITGITKGLGRALLETYDKHGWTIIGCGRSQHVIDQLKLSYDSRHFLKALDVTVPSSVKLWQEEVHLSHGIPDLIINNASIINNPEKLWNTSHEEFTSVINVNLTGPFNIIKSFIPCMLKNKAIVANISSYWGAHGEANVGPYCASKFALEGLTQSLAKELPSNIITLAIDPGIMQTGMLELCSSKEVYKQGSLPSEIANAIYSKLLKVQPSDSGTTINAN